MSLSPVAFIAPNYRDFTGRWIKFYEPGTTTAKIIYLDPAGVATAAKVQINSGGFIVSAASAIVVPYISGSYDAYIFVTEALADANDTSGAERIADNITGSSSRTISIFDNIDEMKSNVGVSDLDSALCRRYRAGGQLVPDLFFNIVSSATVDGYIDHALDNGTFAIHPITGSTVLALAAGFVADGSDNNAQLAAVTAKSLTLDMTGAGVVSLLSTVQTSTGLSVYSNDGSSGFTGFDGLGVNVTAGNVSILNVVITNFYDGTDLNTINYTTGFCRIAENATISSVKIKNNKITNTRAFVFAGALTDDYNPDTTIIINDLLVTGNIFNSTPLPINFNCPVVNSKVTENTFKNVIGASRTVAGVRIFVDGLVFNSPIYDTLENCVVSNNNFHTVINRTTTGDSSTGNNYECHAVQVSANNATVTGNTITDVTGVNFDCEAIYVKAKRYTITGNTLYNSGSIEGAINCKGTTLTHGDAGPIGNPYVVDSNIIVFDNYSYDNAGTIVALDRVGISCAVPKDAQITNNTIIGANEQCVLVNGLPSDENSGLTIRGNKFIDFKGQNACIFRGAFQNLDVKDNKMYDCTTDSDSVRMFNFIAVSGRGVSHKNLNIKNNSCKLGDKVTNITGSNQLIFVAFDGESYDYDTVIVNDNLIDIKHASASIRPITFTRQTGAPTGEMIGFECKGNTFSGLVTSYTQVIYWGDLFNPLTFNIDFEYKLQTTDNTNIVGGWVAVSTNRTFFIEADFNASLTTDRSEIHSQQYKAIGHNTAGTNTLVNSASQYLAENTTGVSSSLDVSSNLVRVRLAGNAAETYDWSVRIKADCL